MIIALGQGKSHGRALLSKTKNDDFPNGLAQEFIEKAKKASKPSGASAVIEMNMELNQLQLKGPRDFYNEVVSVMNMKSHSRIMNCAADGTKSNSTNFDRL